MLRIFRETMNKPAATQYKAAVDLVTGLAVVLDYAAGTITLPPSDSGINLSFITKEHIPVGLDVSRGEISDYDPAFNTLATDEFGKVYTFLQGDVFGTDQYSLAGLTVGDLLSAGVDGKLKKASSGTSSVYRYLGEYDDAGHTLIQVAVLHAPETSA